MLKPVGKHMQNLGKYMIDRSIDSRMSIDWPGTIDRSTPPENVILFLFKYLFKSQLWEIFGDD